MTLDYKLFYSEITFVMKSVASQIAWKCASFIIIVLFDN